ncbi:GAF domain-containing protein (plasmid) [Deinococcus taeanensis]|nr:GAF domain-containing protein [Deinococcus taeanensis]
MVGQTFLTPESLGGPAIDTTNCEREPIHLPGSVQPHGALLTADPQTLTVMQASANAAPVLGWAPEALLGQPLAALVGDETVQALLGALPEGVPDHVQHRALLTVPAGRRVMTAHRTNSLLILEFEPGGTPDAFWSADLRNAVFTLERAATLHDLTAAAARVIRDVSSFDRVMIYRFGADASGEVIAEAHREDLSPFLGHRYPASDIPPQARALYVRHLLRLTADTEAPAAPLLPVAHPVTGAPTPLGGAVLRSTSPMHLQYLRNMGVRSSLSVSIVVDGALWGLIACHHGAPLVLPHETRTTLEYLGRILSLQVQIKVRADTDAFRAGRRGPRERLRHAAAHSTSPLTTFTAHADDLMNLMNAGGVIVAFEGRWQGRGTLPAPDQVEDLLAWLRAQPAPLYHTDHLRAAWPGAVGLERSASGVLAVSVGSDWQELIVWLRPEVATTIAWGGATPEQAKDELGPRRSFDTYLQAVAGQSAPWHDGELEEAAEVQQFLTAALGERLSVLRDLNAALQQSNAEWRQYAFVIAHDLHEPVRLVTQYAEMFRLKFSDQVDARAEYMLQVMLAETARLRSLTHDLQTYTALLSGPPLTPRPVNLTHVIQNLRGELPQDATLDVPAELPVVRADPELLRTLLRHLLTNAVTFAGTAEDIALRATRQPGGWALSVQDSGPGIAPEYHDKIFGLFQRLGRREDSGGNGIGLALCRKIAQLHGGTLRVHSAPGQGSTFTVTLPDAPGGPA